MKFNVLTLFPEMIETYCNFSIIKRAIENNIIEVRTINPRDYTHDKHKKVDDTPYGGGAGMVLKPEPYIEAYESIEHRDNSVTVMMSPQGKPFNEKLTQDLAKYDEITILCGHYEGFDERIKNYCDMEISIGDYILSGGEIPAMVLVDSIIRLLPGVIKEESHIKESFESNLLDYPTYTKPRVFEGYEVPEILLSGDHK